MLFYLPLLIYLCCVVSFVLNFAVFAASAFLSLSLALESSRPARVQQTNLRGGCGQEERRVAGAGRLWCSARARREHRDSSRRFVGRFGSRSPPLLASARVARSVALSLMCHSQHVLRRTTRREDSCKRVDAMKSRAEGGGARVVSCRVAFLATAMQLLAARRVTADSLASYCACCEQNKGAVAGRNLTIAT